MAIANILPDYDKFLDFLVEKATPEEILAFRVSESLQARADELSELNKEGKLTSQQIIELQQMLEFDEWVSLLKSKALKALNA
jgi:hypothetical protein